MDTFYAWTDTFVAVSLASLLPAGNYTVELTLADDLEGVETAAIINLVVETPPTSASGGGDGPGLTPVGPGGAAQSMALILAGLALVLAVLGLGAFVLARKRRQARP
jgi:LPXTG-motif cell wall-anchored protein